MIEGASYDCDVLVVGTGAAGLTAAVTAGKAGLNVLVVEKEPVFGGTTATSGGVMWIPGTSHSKQLSAALGICDTFEKARAYLADESGNYVDMPRIEAFLTYGPEVVDFLERETEAKFAAVRYPDYHSENPNSSIARSIKPIEYQASKLAGRYRTLKPQLPQTLFLGMGFGSLNGPQMKQFMRAGTSVSAFLYTVGTLTKHAFDVLKYGHAKTIYNGRAFVARLAKTAFDMGIQLWLSSPVRELIVEDGRVCGAVVETASGRTRITVRSGIILACGGFPADTARRRAAYPRAAEGTRHRSPTPSGNTGDGIRLGEMAGGVFNSAVNNAAAWMPVSVMPGVSGAAGVWPHLIDRYKPGFMAVLKNGRRFTNEGESYHDFVQHLVQACESENAAECYLIGDLNAVNRYGIGFAKPFPVPRGRHIRSGYLLRGNSLAELAAKAGIESSALERTVGDFNAHSKDGRDPEFGRGSRAYDIAMGDEEHKPNPCLGPIEKPPFFAVKIVPGEIGTFAGLKTDRFARVLAADGAPIHGLYAVGNDAANVFAGAYPGAGGTIGPGVTFGYVAGRHVAGLLPE